jgi:hypothetical protein
MVGVVIEKELTMVQIASGPAIRFSSSNEQGAESTAKYENILRQAKSPDTAETGEYTVSRNPDGDIEVGCKDTQGFYGIVFKPDGSVTQNRAPANGGPQEVIPAGGFDYQKAEDAVSRG